MVVKKVNKRILIILCAFMIMFSSFFSSYKTAYASAALLPVLPEIGVTVGQVVATLLAVCGLTIAYDNRQQIEEASWKVIDGFKDYAESNHNIPPKKTDDWFNGALSGAILLQAEEFADCWEAFKDYCVVKYYSSGIGNLKDSRPQSFEWAEKHASNDDYITFMADYYYNVSEYPYYTIIEGGATTSGSQSCKIVTVFDNVPLLFRNGNELQWISTEVALKEYPIHWARIMSVDRYADNCIFTERTETVVGQSHPIAYGITDLTFNYITSNVPIFDSRENALNWWNENVIDGVLVPSSETPISIIPDNPADFIYQKNDDLSNFYVIGTGSYVDENGQIIPQGIQVLDWSSLIGLGTGIITWEDALQGTIPLEKTENAPLADSQTIPTTNNPEVEDVKDRLTDVSQANPFLADLKTLFPFCIPFDLIDCIRLFNANAEAPHFEWTLSLNPIIDYEYTFEIDLSIFDDVAVICRAMFCILFMVGLAFATRELIRG